MRSLLALAAAMAAAGCGGGITGYTANDGCHDVWTAVCDRYYQCYNPTQVMSAGLPPTAAECAVMLGATECSGFTDDKCANGLTFYPGNIDACTAGIGTVDCMLVADAPDTVPACDPVCQ